MYNRLRGYLLAILCAMIVGLRCNKLDDSISDPYGVLVAEDELSYVLHKNLIGSDEKREFVADKDTVIITNSGIICYLPSGSIVATSGERYYGVARLKLIEVLDLFSALKYNLQTINNHDELIQSFGMIYFSVEDSIGNELKVQNNTIRVEIPSSVAQDSAVKHFYAKPDKNSGTLKWEQLRDMCNSCEWYTVPLDDSALSAFYEANDTNGKLDLIKRSFIATPEFMYSMRAQDNSFNGAILKYYFEAAIKGYSLFSADSSVLAIYTRDHKSASTDSFLYYGSDDLTSTYYQYSRARLHKPIYLENYNIDLTSNDSRRHLLSKGVSRGQVEKILYAYKRSQRIKDKGRNLAQAYYLLEIDRSGWHNLDKLFENPQMKSIDMHVRIVNYDSFDYAESFLILPQYSVLIKATNNNGLLSFSNGDSLKLPHGADATILTLSNLSDQVFYSSSRVTISDMLTLDVHLKSVKTEIFHNEVAHLKTRFSSKGQNISNIKTISNL